MHPTPDNVPIPFVLPPPTLDVAQRLITTLMTLFRAVADVAAAGGTRTCSELAAHALFHRLTRLIAALIRIATDGPRPQARPRANAASSRAPAAPTAPNPLRTENERLRTESGWLVEALPDTAPAIADEIATLLVDPAMAVLLDSEPSLLHALNPLLRSLGLAPLPTAAGTPPDAAPPRTPEPPSSPPAPPAHHSAPQPNPPKSPTLGSRLRTSKSFQ